MSQIGTSLSSLQTIMASDQQKLSDFEKLQTSMQNDNYDNSVTGSQKIAEVLTEEDKLTNEISMLQTKMGNLNTQNTGDSTNIQAFSPNSSDTRSSALENFPQINGA